MLVVVIIEQRLGAADAGGLHALLALLGDEGDGLTLLKGLEAVLLLRESVMSSGEMRSVSDMLSRALCVCCSTARLSTCKRGRSYLNGAEVDEEVSGAVLGGDEAVALLVVEPLDGAVLAFGGGVHIDELGCVGGGVDVSFFGGEW